MIFNEVKQAVNIIDVARCYGIEVDRGGKCRCPFHNERTPSFSISEKKQVWHCFGCGKGGDVISLVAEIFNVNQYTAARKIANDFGIAAVPTPRAKSRLEKEKRFKEWVIFTQERFIAVRRTYFMQSQPTEIFDYYLDILDEDPTGFYKQFKHQFENPKYISLLRNPATMAVVPDNNLKFYRKVMLNF